MHARSNTRFSPQKLLWSSSSVYHKDCELFFAELHLDFRHETNHCQALSQETITWLPTIQETVHAYKTWAVGGLNYLMTLAFMTPAKFYENGKWRDWGIQMNNNKNFFCLKETKLNHVQATEGKCSKLPLPFLSNLALQALIIKVMHGASVIQFFILSPSHRHAGFYKPTLERYSPFLLLTSISLLPFLINFVKFSTLHWQK